MEKTLALLQKLGFFRQQSGEELDSTFDRRMKKIDRARQTASRGPIFKNRSLPSKA